MDMLPTPGHTGGGSTLLTASPEHSVVLVGLVFLPIVLLAIAALAELMRPSSAWARTLLDGVGAASPFMQVSMLLMLISAAIHFVLIPAHINEDPVRAGLFALDGAAFVGVVLLAYFGRPWRRMAALLLVATIATYFIYVLIGREDMDLVGLVTKVIELIALAGVVLSAVSDPSPDASRIPTYQQPNNSHPQEVLG